MSIVIPGPAPRSLATPRSTAPRSTAPRSTAPRSPLTFASFAYFSANEAHILLGPLQRLAAPLRFRDKATWRVVAKDAAALGADPAEVSIALRMALSLEGVEYRPK
jgi:hypothetical protein